MGTDPTDETRSTGMNDPVQGVSWYDVITFCNKLSIAEGKELVYGVSGNVDEWIWDGYLSHHADSYSDYYGVWLLDPTGPDPTSYSVRWVRGGSWEKDNFWDAFYSSHYLTPSSRSIGFRVVSR